jgi:hypothetical protein
LDLKSPKKPKPPKKGEYLIDYLDGRPGEGTVGNKFEVMKPTKLKGGSSGRLEKGDIVLMHWWEGADGGYDTKNMIGAIPHFEKMGDTEFDEEVGIAGEDGGIAGAIDRKDSFLIDGGWWHPKKGVLRPYRGLTKRYLQEFRGGKKAARVASLPLMSPLYNMREVCKQIVLLEDHLNHPPKRCPDCISKHFLTIEALIEEAVSLDIKGEHEDLLGLPSFCRALQQSWLDGGSEQQIAQALRKLRKAYMPDCFEIRSASFIAGVYMSRGKHVCGK